MRTTRHPVWVALSASFSQSMHTDARKSSQEFYFPSIPFPRRFRNIGYPLKAGQPLKSSVLAALILGAES